MSIIPFKEVKLGEICNFYLGLTYTPKYVEKGIPFLSVKDLKKDKISFKNIKYISEKEFEESTSNAKPKKGDILFGRVGTLGNPIIIDFDTPFCIFVSLGFIRVHENISNGFIKHWISSSYFMKQVDSQVAGSAQKNLNVGWLKNFKLSLPPLEEQKKIADILSTVDQKIAFVEDNISEIQELKKGLMQKLLTKGIGHTEFKDSELGRIPESWEVKEIGEISSVLDPHPSHRAPKEDSNGYPFVGIGDISVNGIIDIESSRKVSLKDIENQNSSISVNENDIGFGRVATVGKVIKFRGDYTIPFALSPTMAIMKVKDIQKEYFYQYLTSNMTKKQFKNFTSGSTRISLGIQNLRKLLVCIPPEEEQKQIAEILSTVDQKLEILKDKKQSFEELKTGLMQKLLSGEVRV